jgi:DNA-binding transcriptional ArsR family regulator
MSNQSSPAAVETALDALGDPMRRRIVERLRRGPMPVGELAGRV